MGKLLKSAWLWLLLTIAVGGIFIYLLTKQNAKQKEEIERLELNQQTLLGDVAYYTNEAEQLTASVQRITLRADELEALIPSYEREVRTLRLRVSDLESIAHLTTQTNATVEAPIEPYVPPDTIELLGDKIPQTFRFADNWLSVEGRIAEDAVECNIKVVDSLVMVAHRKPRYFLGWKVCKGKIVYYDVVSKNPYTTISSLEYIEVDVK